MTYIQAKSKLFLRYFLPILAIVQILLVSFSISAFAQQSATNPILLRITRVVKDGKDLNVDKTTNNVFSFNGDITDSDALRYQFDKISLNTKYKDKPAKGGGYLKVYLDSEKDENYLADTGLDDYPFKISKISSRLRQGANKLLFVLIDYTGKPAIPASKVVFNFNYKKVVNKPTLTIVKPVEGSLFAKGVSQDIQVELENFRLSASNDKGSDVGKLSISYNDTKNVLSTITNATTNSDGKVVISLKSDDLPDIAKIPDSLSTKLIFTLQDTSGKAVGVQSEVSIKTNFNNSIDVGLPKISIIEPRKDSSNLSVDGSRKFIVDIQNFQVLSEAPLNPNDVSENQGFLQIIVDDKPLATIWSKTEFTLDEIGVDPYDQGAKTVKVQLVNTNFEKLNPDVNDSIDVIYTPKPKETTKSDPVVQNNNWRLVIISITVVLIIAGIAILITKG